MCIVPQTITAFTISWMVMHLNVSAGNNHKPLAPHTSFEFKIISIEQGDDDCCKNCWEPD